MLFVYYLLLILAPHPLWAEVTDGLETQDAQAEIGQITQSALLYNSPQCKDAEVTPQRSQLLMDMGSTFQKEMLARASGFYLEQTFFLRSKGVLRETEFNAQKGQVAKTVASCSQHPFQKQSIDVLNQKINSQRVTSDNSPDDILFQKRYLAAFVETHRILQTVAASQNLSQEDQKAAIHRLEKLYKYYPLTELSATNSDGQMPKVDFGKDVRNPMMSRYTHDKLDDFLFPDESGKFKTVAPQPEVNNFNFSAKFINDLQTPAPLPPALSSALSQFTANALNPVLRAQEGLCKQDACATLAIAPSALTETLNSMDAPSQNEALNAACLCKFGQNTKFVNDAAMGISAGSALGFGAACLLTGGFGCLGASVFGVITLGASEANIYGSFSDLAKNSELTTIAQNLPSTTAADLAQLRAYQNGIYADLGLGAAGAIAGQGVASGAGYLLKGRGQAIANFIKRLIPASGARKLPPGAVSLMRTADGNTLGYVKDAQGRMTYFTTGPDGIKKLNMDPTGYALAVGGESRAVLEAAATNGKSVIILDANHLGLVNYMPKGLSGGDDYLNAIARIAYEKTGGKAVIARYGGDEYALVTDITDPVELQRLTQEISDAVIRDPASRAVFLAQKQLNRDIYKAMDRSSSYAELPASVKATLSQEEIDFAQTNWTSFRETAMTVTKKMIFDSAAVQPSLSAGSAIVGNRTPNEAFTLANKALNCVKTVYKEALCLDTSKYRGRSPYIPMDELVKKPRKLGTKPQTLLPE